MTQLDPQQILDWRQVSNALIGIPQVGTQVDIRQVRLDSSHVDPWMKTTDGQPVVWIRE